MSWIPDDAKTGILMPSDPVQAPLAIPKALSLAKAFEKHRFYMNQELVSGLGLFLKGDETLEPEVMIDLSRPPERPSLRFEARMRITSNPNATHFNVLIRTKAQRGPEVLNGLLRVMGVKPVDFKPEIPGATERAKTHMQRSGYYQGRLRVFLDASNPDLENGFRKLLGTEVMFFSPGQLDMGATLMMLRLSDLYIGGNSIFTGFALLFGNKCALRGLDPAPFGPNAIKMVNPKQTLKRLRFIEG